MAGFVEGADCVGDVGGFGLRELDERAEPGVDVATEIYQAIILFHYAHLHSLHRLDHGFDEFLLGSGATALGVIPRLLLVFWLRLSTIRDNLFFKSA